MNKKTVKVMADKEVRKESLNLQYKFSAGELQNLGKELAEAQITLRQIEDDKKRVLDDWKARESSKSAEINNLSNKVSSGYEYRDIPCEVTINEPVNKKTARRLDTGEVVWVRELTDLDKQRTFEFENEEGQS
jgi:hypothetical protein